VFADDYKEVSDTGVKGKSEAFQTLEDGVITGYWFDDVRVVEQNRQVAVITYKISTEASTRGRRSPPSSITQLRSG